MARVTIIVPCYNEAERLDWQRFKAFTCNEHEVVFLFVNDGSTDATGPFIGNVEGFGPV